MPSEETPTLTDEQLAVRLLNALGVNVGALFYTLGHDKQTGRPGLVIACTEPVAVGLLMATLQRIETVANSAPGCTHEVRRPGGVN